MTPPLRSTFGIGASDIAAIAGQSKYSSPWDVYKRLINRDEIDRDASIAGYDAEAAAQVLADLDEQHDESDMHTRTGWGHRLEPAIRQAYCDETGLQVIVPGSIFHRDQRWARATPDGIASVFAADGTPNPPFTDKATSTKHGLDAASMLLDPKADHLVQCKNVGQFAARDWEGAPPAYVQLQEQWELFVTGLARADVAALIGGGEFQIYTVWRDDKLIEDLATIAEDFWQRVLRRQPPDIDASNACRDHIGRRLSDLAAVEVAADARAEQLAATYQRHYLAFAAAEVGKKLAANQLLDVLAVAGATKLRTELGVITTRRVPEKTVQTVDWEAVARALASASDLDAGWFDALIANYTTTTTKAAQLSLVAPRSWSALKKGTAE